MSRGIRPRGLERVPFGQTGLRITRLGLGTVPLGGKYQPISAQQAVETVHAALHVGIKRIVAGHVHT